MKRATLTGVMGLAVVGALLATAGVGCATPKRADFPVVYSLGGGTGPNMGVAPADADYVLYKNNDEMPMARHHLRGGDRLGFSMNASVSDPMLAGKPAGPAAVAGDFVVPLDPTQSYEWRRIPNSSHAEKAANPYKLRP